MTSCLWSAKNDVQLLNTAYDVACYVNSYLSVVSEILRDWLQKPVMKPESAHLACDGMA